LSTQIFTSYHTLSYQKNIAVLRKLLRINHNVAAGSNWPAFCSLMEGAVQGWIYAIKKEARTSQWGVKATSSLGKVLKLTITSHSAATIGLSGS